MHLHDKFALLCSILRDLGLSAEAVDDIFARILEFLGDRDGKEAGPIEFPYLVRDDFLLPAEQNFYLVRRMDVSDWALIGPRAALGIYSVPMSVIRANTEQRQTGLTASRGFPVVRSKDTGTAGWG